MLKSIRDRERGSVAVFTAVLAIGVIFLVGLIVDGGNALSARERAYDIAEQAARAAADDLATSQLRATGTVAIDWTTACTYAQREVTSYAATFNSVTSASMATCAQGKNAATATVSVTVHAQPIIPGFGTLTATETATATSECGTATQGGLCN
jgi:Flp pilus assembly protein TadG